MSKNLLHKTQILEFLEWCKAKGLQVRGGKGDYQLAQIQPKGSKEWMCIYERDHMPEHVTVDHRLDPLVKNFIKQTRGPTLVQVGPGGVEFIPLEPDHD